MKTGVSNSLNVWQNSQVKPSGSKLFFVRRLLIMIKTTVSFTVALKIIIKYLA